MCSDLDFFQSRFCKDFQNLVVLVRFISKNFRYKNFLEKTKKKKKKKILSLRKVVMSNVYLSNETSKSCPTVKRKLIRTVKYSKICDK